MGCSSEERTQLLPLHAKSGGPARSCGSRACQEWGGRSMLVTSGLREDGGASRKSAKCDVRCGTRWVTALGCFGAAEARNARSERLAMGRASKSQHLFLCGLGG